MKKIPPESPIHEWLELFWEGLAGFVAFVALWLWLLIAMSIG